MNVSFFDIFWNYIKSSDLWGGIVRATRYDAFKIIQCLSILNLSFEDAEYLANKINQIPEDCKNSEVSIKIFLQRDKDFIKFVNGLSFFN